MSHVQIQKNPCLALIAQKDALVLCTTKARCRFLSHDVNIIIFDCRSSAYWTTWRMSPLSVRLSSTSGKQSPGSPKTSVTLVIACWRTTTNDIFIAWARAKGWSGRCAVLHWFPQSLVCYSPWRIVIHLYSRGTANWLPAKLSSNSNNNNWRF